MTKTRPFKASWHRGATQTESDKSTATDWSDPDDAENPQNWPQAKKIYHTLIPAAVGFLWSVRRRTSAPFAKQEL